MQKRPHFIQRAKNTPLKTKFLILHGNLSQLQRYLISKNQNKIGVYFGSCSGGLCSCAAAIVIGMSISAGTLHRILELLK